jgi:hypothetical protein
VEPTDAYTEHTGDQAIDRVGGLAKFRGLGGALWTEAEMAPIIEALARANEQARIAFGVAEGENGLRVSWMFHKRAGVFGAPYWSWLSTWRSSSWGDNTPEEVAARLRQYYQGFEDIAVRALANTEADRARQAAEAERQALRSWDDQLAWMPADSTPKNIKRAQAKERGGAPPHPE